ncbi:MULTISPECIES: amidohydrolase family protein [Spongiibacter]|uniref:amidohydrolase family protein n=1 Tax=Spongiibacter TaxID=630749 RepID=UPI00257C6F07|nr:amidohydrolase family protein [Spongiibacter sp. UBA1325]|tara:strand:+ start:17853 stop:19355 length:1503 start_codon:yes stop_codon:yes gene_type:complete
MVDFFTKKQRQRFRRTNTLADATPIPTRSISNGEYDPMPRTNAQRQVEGLIHKMADEQGKKMGLSRRDFLRSSSGMAASFLAMNTVYGSLFNVSAAEAAELDRAEERRKRLSKQFIFDDQVHFVHEDFDTPFMLDYADYAAEHWNPHMFDDIGLTLDRYRFDNFIKEVFIDSDTKVCLVSSAPTSGELSGLLISNKQMALTRELVNRLSGTERMLCHSVVIPGQPGWLDDVDKSIEVFKPNAWKGYTVGNPFHPKNLPYRLDDEKLMYPFYEKMLKSGINTICIHKGLLPKNYLSEMSDLWPYATVDDVPKAAKDWPDINFVIYHAALRPWLEVPDKEMAEFERTGYIPWVSDLAAIPEKYGVNNVYGEIGSSFAQSAVAHPRFCAAFLGTLIKGMGVDHVLWGTDSVWYGSPQWQIEALRRLEIPQDMQMRFGFAPLGPEDGPVKNAIFGLNGAKLYGVDPGRSADALAADTIELMKSEYHARGVGTSNNAYGYTVDES